jgi:hypothetical protein
MSFLMGVASMANPIFDLVGESEMFRRASILALALAAVVVELDAEAKSLLLAALADFHDQFATSRCPEIAESTEWWIQTYAPSPEDLRVRRAKASRTYPGSE